MHYINIDIINLYCVMIYIIKIIKYNKFKEQQQYHHSSNLSYFASNELADDKDMDSVKKNGYLLQYVSNKTIKKYCCKK